MASHTYLRDDDSTLTDGGGGDGESCRLAEQQASGPAAKNVPQTAATPHAVASSFVDMTRVEHGISSQLGGIDVYAGSITAFVKPRERHAAAATLRHSLSLPCTSTHAETLPVCTKPGSADDTVVTATEATAAVGGSMTPNTSLQDKVRTEGNTATLSSLPQSLRHAPTVTATTTPSVTCTTRETSALSSSLSAATAAAPSLANTEAERYYSSLPANALTKEEMWARIRATHDVAAQPVLNSTHKLAADEVDYLKLRTEMQEHDLFHYRIGALAFADVQTRRDYYAVWSLAMSLNRARWTMLDVRAQQGTRTTGAGVKLLFWKEAVYALLDQRGGVSAPLSSQFTDSHPVLRPFAAMLQRRRGLTRAFVRGFTEARLRPVQQPGNVSQLLEHFDKFYGYLYNTVLQAVGIKDEAAEHMLHHIGRAVGLTTHCVLYWKKYAKLGVTLLPADMCADHCVNVALLQNLALASRDRAVRRVLYDVLCIAKHEMLQAQRLAKDVTPLAWPVVAECWHTNYYLDFLQRRSYNVSAMFADYNVENPGLWWYYVKKLWQWRRRHSIADLVDDAAPLPLLGIAAVQRGSKYKMTGTSRTVDGDTKANAVTTSTKTTTTTTTTTAACLATPTVAGTHTMTKGAGSTGAAAMQD